MKHTNAKKTKFTVLALALVIILSIGMISAYFTDADSETNTFTIGEISLNLSEPDWDPPADITPLQEIEKDPQVKNDGENPEYIFVTVEVPVASVVTAKADGTLLNNGAKTATELFSYTLNSGWVEFQEATDGTDANGNTVKIHYYAYATSESSLTALAVGSTTTSAVFDKVTFANVIEGEIAADSLNIVVNAYGIQTANVNGGKTDADSVWAVIAAQRADA